MINLEKATLSLGILVIGIIISKYLANKLRKWARGSVGGDFAEIVDNFVYYVLAIFTVMISLSNAWVDISGLLTLGGIVGVVVGFASKTVASNLVSGIFLLVDGAIKLGETVKVKGEKGEVKEIKPFSTILEGEGGAEVRIPNDKLFSSKIIRYRKKSED